MIDKRNLTRFVRQLRTNNQWYFNCWCFTALLEQWESNTRWFDREDMKEYLEEKTVPVNYADLRYGDILVYYIDSEDYDNDGCDDEEILTHTAFYIGKGIAIHKPGQFPIERIEVDDIPEQYPTYGRLSMCVRPIESVRNDKPDKDSIDEGENYQLTLQL